MSFGHRYSYRVGFFLSLVWGAIFCVTVSCGQVQEDKSKGSYIVPVDSLQGKDYLESKFLKKIQEIQISPQKAKSYSGMILIIGGEFQMGGDFPADTKEMPETALPQGDEFPKHPVRISDFYMDEHEVTIGEFMEFVQKTGYKTVAEYDIDWEELKNQLPLGTPKPSEEKLKAGSLVFHLAKKSADRNNLANWWNFVKGCNWKNPDGKNVDIDKLKNFPVTQVSWYDAMAYAKWVGKRLPTEAEYEYAMRGGEKNTMYPWGNELVDKGLQKGNFLQGEFPYTNTVEDGFFKRSPVKSFDSNAYGLYDIAGNVWEWTSDWYSPLYYKKLKDKNKVSANPQGPEKSVEIHDSRAINKVIRGGSFLCNDNWCSGFRNARRMRLSPDSGMEHLGFRLVRSR